MGAPAPDVRGLNTIALLGPYVPRASALATFTKDLHDHLTARLGDGSAVVLAVDDKPEDVTYPKDVRFRLHAEQERDYLAAADLLNINRIDACIVQHSPGLYGGGDDALLLEFVRHFRMPVLCMLHGVDTEPLAGQANVMHQLIECCDRLVVTEETEARVLRETYDAPAEKIVLILCEVADAGPEAVKDVAERCLEVADEIVRRRQKEPRAAGRPRREPSALAVPDIDFGHLRTLTDDTGVIQHATYTVPERRHGYCTDDAARALVAVLTYNSLWEDSSLLGMANVCLSFIEDAFNTDAGRFRNFMAYNRTWLEEVGSEDMHGRALWALGITTAYAPNDGALAFSTRLFNEALPPLEAFTSPRAWAFALVGIHAYLRRFAGDARARRVRKMLSGKLHAQFEDNRDAEWPWCEDSLTYDNAKLPHALILSGQWLPDGKMLDLGLESLAWLLQIQTAEDGHLTIIGNRGWLERSGKRACFDQQPIEAMALIEACAEAYRCTRDRTWSDEAVRCLGWFLGRNDAHSMLYDAKTGGCSDGLHSDGPNENEGAESTLAWLISLITVHELLEEQARDRR